MPNFVRSWRASPATFGRFLPIAMGGSRLKKAALMPTSLGAIHNTKFSCEERSAILLLVYTSDFTYGPGKI